MKSFSLVYLGTNTLLLRRGTACLVIDPHFTRPGLLSILGRIAPDPEAIRRGLATHKIDSCDAVLLTHTHYDHALDAVETVRQTGARLLGSQSASYLTGAVGMSNAQFELCLAGDEKRIAGFQVQFLPGRHIALPAFLGHMLPGEGRITAPVSPPAKMTDYQCGQVLMINIDGLLVLGSAGFVPGVLQRGTAHTVVLSIGGLETRSPVYLRRFYQETVLASGAKRVLLSHWDNFFRPLKAPLPSLGLARMTMRRIKQLGAQWGQKVQTLRYGKPMKITQDT